MPSIRQCFKLGCVADGSQHDSGCPNGAPTPSGGQGKPPAASRKSGRQVPSAQDSFAEWARAISKTKARKDTNASTVLHFFQNQKEFFNILWPYLAPSEKRNIRACCSLTRGVANSLQTRIRLTEAAAKATNLHTLPIAFPNLTHAVVAGTLPEPVLLSIFQLRSLCANLTSLEIDTPSFITPSCLQLLPKAAPRLQHLAVHAKPGTISCEFLSACSVLPRLTSLSLLGCHALSAPQWLPLSDMVQLTSLHLEGIRDLPFHTMTVLLTPLDRLARLSFASCAFVTDHDYVIASGPTLCSLSSLTALTSISISNCSGVLPSVLNSLPSLPNLRTLTLPNSLPAGHHLCLPSTLQHLDISNNQFPDSPAPQFDFLTPLTSLCLASTSLSLPTSLLQAPTPTLRHLDISQSSTSPETLSAVFSIHTLTHLCFSSPQAFPQPLPKLAQLTNLESLSCNLTLDRALLPILSTLPHLSTLSVKSILLWPNSGTLSALTHLCATSCHQFGDHDWYDIADTTHVLQSLELHACSRVTDAGLANIAVHLPNLTALRLTGLYKVSPTGCLSLIPHRNLREVHLGLPQMSPAQLFTLTQQLSTAGLYAQCSPQEES